MDGDREDGEVEEVGRFSTRPPSLREMLWVRQLAEDNTNLEALSHLLESRRIDPTWNVLDLSGEELAAAVLEMVGAINQASIVEGLLKTVT